MAIERHKWRSITLRPWAVTLLLITELGLLCGIAALYKLSNDRTGFVNIGFEAISTDITDFQDALEAGRPLLWTSLPTLIIVLYKIFRESVIESLKIETPFIELENSSREHPTKVDKSVYLDYRASFAVLALYKAFKNDHKFLSVCMLLSFVVSIVLVPLAARLFAERVELLPNNTAINLLSTFDPSADITNIDYGALMDAVSASWVRNASFPSGTDGNFSVPQISPTQNHQNYTIALDTISSQLTLDCQIIDNPMITTTLETDNALINKISFDDRDCTVSGEIRSASNWPAYSGAFSTRDCAEAAGSTRVSFLYATFSSGELGNPVLISCIPSYWNVSGILEVTAVTNLNGQRVETPSFASDSYEINELPDFKRQQFEEQVTTVLSVNVGSDINTSNRLAELVARFVEDRGLNFSEETLIRAASTIYPAVYTMLCVEYFFPDLQQPMVQRGILRIPENRLHVVQYAANSMLVILGVLIAETIYLIYYLAAHRNMLAEEPIGLVGAANILLESNICSLVAPFHHSPDFDGRLRRRVTKGVHTDDYLLERKCWAGRVPGSGRMKIVVDSEFGDTTCAERLGVHGRELGVLGSESARRYTDQQHRFSPPQSRTNQVYQPFGDQNWSKYNANRDFQQEPLLHRQMQQ